MSVAVQPIALHRFREALRDLPVSRVFDTVVEIRNSQKHLARSNDELRPYADQGDEDCIKVIDENLVVMDRMRRKLELLRIEVEARGLAWKECEEAQSNGTRESAQTDTGDQNTSSSEAEELNDVHL